MKSFPSHSLPAATLLETLVSFALVSIIFVIGAIIWLQLAGNAAPYRQADQRLDCRNILRETETKADLTDKVFTLHNTQYHRKITPINPDRGLFEVSIAAYTPDGIFLMRRHKTIHIHAQ
jgi:hypothetical protein